MKYPVDWEYELSQEPPEAGSELHRELDDAAFSCIECAGGEALFDLGKFFTKESAAGDELKRDCILDAGAATGVPYVV